MSFRRKRGGVDGDDAEVRGNGNGIVTGGTDLGVQEEGGSVLEVEHLATKLVGLGINKGELVGEVLGEDRLGDGHPDVSSANDGDLDVLLFRQRRSLRCPP